MSWLDTIDLISAPVRRRLQSLPDQTVIKGAVLFRPGDAAQGFV
ncbi:MAG: hypothetical protein RL128_1088, partial [Pseudomonadota bacterium]